MGDFNKTRLMTIPLAVDTNAYAGGDVVGGLLTFPKVRSNGGRIVSVILTDDDNEKKQVTLHLFNEKPSTIADNAAFAPTVGDLKKRFGRVIIYAGDYETLNNNAQAIKEDRAHDFEAKDGLLYGYLVANEAVTFTAATDLHLRVGIWED